MSLPTKDAAGWVLGDAHTTPEEMYSALLEMIDAADVVRPLGPDHSRDVWLVGVDGWFGLWCGVGWLIGVCRGSGGAGGLVRGA